jgi:hypothetical protein
MALAVATARSEAAAPRRREARPAPAPAARRSARFSPGDRGAGSRATAPGVVEAVDGEGVTVRFLDGRADVPRRLRAARQGRPAGGAGDAVAAGPGLPSVAGGRRLERAARRRGAAAAQKWPQTLWVVRHGQSSGNVARDAAEAAGLADITIAERDVDVPLSPLGERQSDALGRWFVELRPSARRRSLLARPTCAPGRRRSGCARRSSPPAASAPRRR